MDRIDLSRVMMEKALSLIPVRKTPDPSLIVKKVA